MENSLVAIYGVINIIRRIFNVHVFRRNELLFEKVWWIKWQARLSNNKLYWEFAWLHIPGSTIKCEFYTYNSLSRGRFLIMDINIVILYRRITHTIHCSLHTLEFYLKCEMQKKRKWNDKAREYNVLYSFKIDFQSLNFSFSNNMRKALGF